MAGRYKFLKDDTTTKPRLYSFGDVMVGTPNADGKTIYFTTNRGGINVDKSGVQLVDESTPLYVATPPELAQAQQQAYNAYIASSVGLLAGLGYAFYKKKGFWGYVGFGLLGSIVAGVGYNIVKKK